MAPVSGKYANEPFARVNSCSRKIAYDTSKAARLALRQMNNHGVGMAGAQIYKCAFCAYFHIGHKSKKRSKNGRKSAIPPLQPSA
jgi:hypothetical protein